MWVQQFILFLRLALYDVASTTPTGCAACVHDNHYVPTKVPTPHYSLTASVSYPPPSLPMDHSIHFSPDACTNMMAWCVTVSPFMSVLMPQAVLIHTRLFPSRLGKFLSVSVTWMFLLAHQNTLKCSLFINTEPRYCSPMCCIWLVSFFLQCSLLLFLSALTSD